jgi:hypothetical protein
MKSTPKELLERIINLLPENFIFWNITYWTNEIPVMIRPLS